MFWLGLIIGFILGVITVGLLLVFEFYNSMGH